tara:strand:+ start:1829 stop:2668 length:840 start_codon:yes stop_codon:yes gene_type:complete
LLPVLSFDNYSFSYGQHKSTVLKNINLEINTGEIVLIAGHSGCGKSTFLKSINGLIPHMYDGVISGSVNVNGKKVSEMKINELATNVGYIFQNPDNQIFMFSVERDIAFGLEHTGIDRNEMRKRVDWAMNIMKIKHLADRAPHTLSDGQKQRVAIAGVLSMKPNILILDEPTSLLDPYTALELVNTLKYLKKEFNMTILIVEHRLDLLVDIIDRILILNQGEVFYDGSPTNILNSQKCLDIGISIPNITMVHNLLNYYGMLKFPTSLTINDLLKKLNSK